MAGENGIEATENELLELRLLLEAIYQKYGYDFRSYSTASIKRRVRTILERSDLAGISHLQHRIIYDRSFFSDVLCDLTVQVSEMFRNPPFFLALRKKVLPILADNPFIKIWHAGCASGEEVYSTAIMLHELGLAEQTQIYATDLNHKALDQARAGIYPIKEIKRYIANYQAAGGIESFSSYYTARYDSVLLDRSLRKNIVFADHNLVTDASFGEMDLIICRNVLIYFNKTLQSRVVQLFGDSLGRGGFLCLGAKESLRFITCSHQFKSFIPKLKVYRIVAKNAEAIGGTRCQSSGE